MDDDRQPEEDDYFEFEGYDVTDQGLGEAARRVKVGQEAGAFSFIGSTLQFERDPVMVHHGVPGDHLVHVEVANVWQVGDLELRARATAAEPTNWQELVETCRACFPVLSIPGLVLDRLARETFYPAVAKRVLVLLSVLQKIMEGRSQDGSLNKDAKSLLSEHTHGDKSWFSDESDENKRRFRPELTFANPDNPNLPLFCPWHGKIKTQQFRIHFEWPVPRGQRQLKILYIGPKITKA